MLFLAFSDYRQVCNVDFKYVNPPRQQFILLKGDDSYLNFRYKNLTIMIQISMIRMTVLMVSKNKNKVGSWF
jgi:hypothetical protein